MNRNLRFPNSRSYVAVARKAVLDAARELGLEGNKLEDLGYAVGEALANAVEHGFRERTYLDVGVRRPQNESAVMVEIGDAGAGFDPSEMKDPQGAALRGYGMTIMRAMADRVSFERNGRLVRIWKYLDRENMQ